MQGLCRSKVVFFWATEATFPDSPPLSPQTTQPNEANEKRGGGGGRVWGDHAASCGASMKTDTREREKLVYKTGRE